MAIPHRLSRTLHDLFGTEAAEAMADWMNGVDGGRAELRGDIAELRHEMRRDFAAVREKMRAGEAALREEMRAGEAALREEMRAGDAALREEMRTGFAAMHQDMAALRTEIAVSKVDVLKWAIGSWIATLGLIAALFHFSH